MQTVPEPLRAVKTDGSYIYLQNGQKLIDAISSWWTACHGHKHPHIISEIQKQLNEMPHVMFGGIVHKQAERLARRISSLLGDKLNRVFFADSGSVAVEVAMKMATQYWGNQGHKTRTRFLSFLNGYHGDTLAAMSVTDPIEGMHAIYGNYIQEQLYAPLPQNSQSIEKFLSLLNSHKDEIAGVIIEPLVQCAGGMKMHKPEVLKIIADAVIQAETLLICDEIAVNFGRTGSLFAHTQGGVFPDIICLGKALTGGVINLAATVTTDNVFEKFLSDDPDKALMHGPTFMASPLACSAANASLDLFESEPWLMQVRKIEKHLNEQLSILIEQPSVVDVRVKGAIGVVEVQELHNLNWLKSEFVKSGIWLRPFGNVIYTMPPFTATTVEMFAITNAILDIVPRWQKLCT